MTITERADPRGRLLAAAEVRFRRFGYKRTTIDDVATEAGTGKGSVYLHFDSKQHIYMAVVEESLDRFIDKAGRVLEAPGTAPQRLRALVELTAAHYGDDELLHASLFGETDLVEGVVAQMAAERQRERICQLLEDVLTTGQTEGTVRAGLDPGPVAAVLFELGWALVRSGLESPDMARLVSSLEILNDIVGLGITPRP
ncbi:MAG: TetR/AcrR family transcriptional regulator [Actinomycetia bacterium]|nr:TetR/AcrR family transcriptional regulator [Actinomycetes bacterium]MCP4961124.1 TetR/AcrR family transcriptional regulator [Actinomycetes bacterium]